MFKINALGKACPLPVIEAHKALKDHDAVEITVDNEIATENLKNLSQEMNCSYTMSQESDTHYTVRLVKEGADVSEDEGPVTSGSDYTVVINAPVMGVGDDQLGKNLLKTFIYTLTEQPAGVPERPRADPGRAGKGHGYERGACARDPAHGTGAGKSGKPRG